MMALESSECPQIVYGIFLGAEALYVGRSARLDKRLLQHFKYDKKHGRLKHVPIESTCIVQFGHVPREVASILERVLIRYYYSKGQCQYNVKPVPKKVGMSSFTCPRCHQSVSGELEAMMREHQSLAGKARWAAVPKASRSEQMKRVRRGERTMNV